jgi:hypothetical protein
MSSHLDPFTYILVDRKPVQHPNNDEWWKWFMVEENRRVALTTISRGVNISTVFTGIDLTPERGCLFETQVFGGEHDREAWRTATWEDAEKKHAEIVEMIEGERT